MRVPGDEPADVGERRAIRSHDLHRNGRADAGANLTVHVVAPAPDGAIDAPGARDATERDLQRVRECGPPRDITTCTGSVRSGAMLVSPLPSRA